MEMVSCTTLGASSSISVTVASWEGITKGYQLPVAGCQTGHRQQATGNCSPHPGLGQLLNLLENPLLLEPAQAVHEEVALQMIRLVAERARHQAFAPHLARRAVAVEEA